MDKEAADKVDFEFDCVLKLYMPGCAGDAARDIKMRIVNAIEKAKVKEDRLELKEKVVKGGVFKLDDSDSEDEEEVEVKVEKVVEETKSDDKQEDDKNIKNQEPDQKSESKSNPPNDNDNSSEEDGPFAI